MADIKEFDWRSQEYAKLVHDDDYAMLYHDPFWLNILYETLQLPIRVLGLWENGLIKAAIPFSVSSHSFLGPVINSLPFFGSIGGIVSGTKGNERRRCLRLLLDDLMGQAKKINAFSINIISRPADPLEDDYRRFIKPDYEDVRTAYIFPLPGFGTDIEQNLFRSFEGRTRTALHKAMKQDYSISITNDIQVYQSFYKLHCVNMQAINGDKKPESFISSVIGKMHTNEVQLWVAKEGQRLIAGALFFLYRHTAEYYMTALDLDYRSYQPLSLIIFEALKSFAERGIRFLNFGGTWFSQDGLKRFKSGWGAKPLTYKYFIKTRDSSSCSRLKSPEQIKKAYPYFYVLPFDHFVPPPTDISSNLISLKCHLLS